MQYSLFGRDVNKGNRQIPACKSYDYIAMDTENGLYTEPCIQIRAEHIEINELYFYVGNKKTKNVGYGWQFVEKVNVYWVFRLEAGGKH